MLPMTAEPQRFSNLPQLPPPELKIRITMGLAPELPQSQMRGPPAIFPAKGRLSSGWSRSFQNMSSHEGQKLALDSSSHQVRGELTLIASLPRAAQPSLLGLT